ncbi:T9SS type A sorting domain-containing protein [Labilibacter sediminis]|nr:T9SS type A sorting domain-containing protein [Labilibacter sediminis]
MRNIYFLIVGFSILVLGSEMSLAQSSWTSITPDKAYVNCVAINPGNGNIMLAGTINGLYRTTNSANDWYKVEAIPNTNITCIEWNPTNTAMVFVGTDNYGIYKSIDGGSTWLQAGLDSLADVSVIEVLPREPQLIFAGGNIINKANTLPTLYYSSDFGNTWELRSDLYTESQASYYKPLNVIMCDPDNDSVIYAAFKDRSDIVISRDRGESWEVSSATSEWGSIEAMAITPEGYEIPTVYAIAHKAFSTGSFIRSIDNGINWEKINVDISLGNVLAIDINFPQYVYFGVNDELYSIMVYDSDNESFLASSTNPIGKPTSIAPVPGVDYPYKFFVSFSSEIEGIYLLDAVATDSYWKAKINGINNFNVLDIACYGIDNSSAMMISRKYQRVFYVENQLVKTNQFGQEFSVIGKMPSFYDNANQVSIDPNDPNFIIVAPDVYLGSAYSSYDPVSGFFNTYPATANIYIYISKDEGTSWNAILIGYTENMDTGLSFLIKGCSPLFYSNNSDEILYAIGGGGGFGGIYKSYDKGENWVLKSGFYANTLVQDPNNLNTVYYTNSTPGYVRCSTDFGESWKFISPKDDNYGWKRTRDENDWAWIINKIVVDNDSHVFAEVDGVIKKWMGETDWIDIPQPPVDAISVMSIDNNTIPSCIYVGSSEGIYCTKDEGQNWILFDDEFDGSTITGLNFTNSNPNYLYAALSYGGVWIKESSATSVKKNEKDGSTINVSVFPNPNNGTFRILSNSEIGRLEEFCIYNMQGEKLYQSNELFVPTNSNGFLVSLNTMHSGVYLLKVKIDKIWMETKFLILP